MSAVTTVTWCGVVTAALRAMAAIVFLRKNPGIAKEVLVGNALVQGTYISYADAATLCGHFNLSQEPAQYLMALGCALDNADQS